MTATRKPHTQNAQKHKKHTQILKLKYFSTSICVLIPKTNNHTTIQQCNILSLLSQMSFFPRSRLTFKMKSRHPTHIAFAQLPVFKHSFVLGLSARTATQPITLFARAAASRTDLTSRKSICAKRAPSTSSRSWPMAGDSNPACPTTSTSQTQQPFFRKMPQHGQN